METGYSSSYHAAMPKTPDLATLRRYAIARSLFAPTTLPRAMARMQYVQADPLRAPARAQDLILRHRVKDYQAGDLERRYPKLAVEEDFFVNYGFVTPHLHALMHPRTARKPWDAQRWKKANELLDFVRQRGIVHPKTVDEAFAHGSTKNWFGGNSRVSTELLDGMHYRGLLRVARREGGTRLYEARATTPVPADTAQAHDALVDAAVALYAPLPAASLNYLVGMTSWGGVPQWYHERPAAFTRAKARLASAVVGGVTWYWPANENPASKRRQPDDAVRLLAPFDPVVWDRRRFELFWGWPYRFEAYTPAAKRVRGHYALPMLWGDDVVGWVNAGVKDERLHAEVGFAKPGKRGSARPGGFDEALAAELARMAQFLGLPADSAPAVRFVKAKSCA